jgi:uncharacterized protein YndB with AHSA1/START domain
MSRVFHTDQRRLFEAWSDPAIMEKWLFPFGEGAYAEVENDFTQGGEYTLDMYEPDGTRYEMNGEYREIDPYDKIVFTWNTGDLQDTLVTLEFNPVGEGTELTLTHEFFPNKEATQQHVGGWEGCFINLEKELSVTTS